jgi:hypothetical protein
VGRVTEILTDPNLSKFNAVAFTLGDSSDLKTRSLGVSPLIAEFQHYVDSRLLLLSSQIQSQAIQIASTEMLRRPLIDLIGRTCKTLFDSLLTSPLSVCLLAGSLSSPSISALLTDALAKQLAEVQQAAALEWAKRTASDLAVWLQAVPQRGAALSFLMHLESAILEAGGHEQHRPLDVHLRSEAFRLVVPHIRGLVAAMAPGGGYEQRKASDARSELVFRDYCLLSRVLSAKGDPETRRLCIGKMNPIDVDNRKAAIESEIDVVLFQSREMIKLISGGRRIPEPQEAPEFDVEAHLALLFGRNDQRDPASVVVATGI